MGADHPAFAVVIISKEPSGQPAHVLAVSLEDGLDCTQLSSNVAVIILSVWHYCLGPSNPSAQQIKMITRTVPSPPVGPHVRYPKPPPPSRIIRRMTISRSGMSLDQFNQRFAARE